MDNAQQHWPILQKLGTDLANRVRSFMVIGKDGKGVIVATEDGQGYWLGEMTFGWGETKTATKPTLLNVFDLVHMAQSDSHILLLNKLGDIYTMGWNGLGQLGLGNVDSKIYLSPQLISIPHKFIFVRCGFGHSLALTEDGKVWAWGRNDSCQVGVASSTLFIPSLHQISELDSHRVVAVECGSYHSLAMTDQGEVYGWGENGSGQLGDGTKSSRHTPTRILTPSPVQSMAAGDNHTLLLTQTGEVYACGDNGHGQLGLSTDTESSDSLVKVPDLPPILQILCHFATNLSIAMSSDQRCFVWGQMTNGTSISKPWELPPVYVTLEFQLSFFSTNRSTPHSVTIPVKKCCRKTDSMTQTELCFDSVPDQTMASPNRVGERMFDNTDSSPDIRFQVGDQSILAHRNVLQISSGHFHRLFFYSPADPNLSSSPTSTVESDFSCSQLTTNPSELGVNSTPITPQCPQVIIPISDHSYPVFHAYLRFLYLDILEVAPEHLADLFSLSVDYLESNLQQLCLSRMRSTLTPSTCCFYYPLTYRHSLPELDAFQQELVQFASTKFLQIIGTAAYQSMNGDLCKKLAISISNLDTC